MSESEDKSPYGPGFIGSCIVVGAIAICGITLVITGGSSDATTHGTAGATSVTTGVTAESEAAAEPAPGTGGAETATGRDTSSCDPGDGDQGWPTKAPAVDVWEVSRKVVVPRSAAFGPVRRRPIPTGSAGALPTPRRVRSTRPTTPWQRWPISSRPSRPFES
jgi:hypothetical protein